VTPLARLGEDDVRAVSGLFFDLDDTLLSHGVLTREAYDALWDLHEAGVHLVAVTGRPSGWAEVFVRQWPIDGAVTENGAAHVVREGKGVRVEIAPDAGGTRDRLASLVAAAASAVPSARLADDVHARRTDVTWDIGEREELAPGDVEALARLVLAHGARTTRSSVHLHATFAVDDKASGAVRFATRRFGQDSGEVLQRWAFAGDSENDAPCFSAFRLTFGVANVRARAGRLPVPPRYVAERARGEGFAEIAAAILRARRCV
jgi:HAD superfamily hydrolase (TIGR01484 family)